MNFKVNTSAKALEESSGSSYMAKSGIYDVTLNFASLEKTTNGAEQVNFNFTWEGNEQTIYGPYVTNTNGQTNEIGAKLINKLAIIAGMGEGDEFELESEDHVVGKDKKSKTFNVISNFSDKTMKIRLQEEYNIPAKGKNAGQIKKSMVIKSFFTDDGTSAEELINGTEKGKRLALETEKYANNITYKDDLTPEAVQAWKDSKKSGGAAASATPQPKVNASANTLFN